MNLNFTVLEAGKTGSKGEEKISINKNGTISFLGAFYKSQSLHLYRYAQLGYDKENEAISIKFLYDSSLNVYRMQHKQPPKKSGATIQSMVLFDRLNKKPEEIVGRYTPHKYEEGENQYYILLSEREYEGKTPSGLPTVR